jgi:hypothetical protein
MRALARRSVIKNLEYQPILIDIAMKDEDDIVRRTAIGKITDESVLTGIMKNENDESICKYAIQRLLELLLLAGRIDQQIIADIRGIFEKKLEDKQTFRAAVSRLIVVAKNNPEILLPFRKQLKSHIGKYEIETPARSFGGYGDDEFLVPGETITQQSVI